MTVLPPASSIHFVKASLNYQGFCENLPVQLHHQKSFLDDVSFQSWQFQLIFRICKEFEIPDKGQFSTLLEG